MTTENGYDGPPPKSEVACEVCGNLLEVGARFCGGCGATVPRTSPTLTAGTEPVARETVRPRGEEPATPDLLSSISWLPPVAAGFAVFALLIVLLVHLLAPDAVAGYSPAELDLKVQMRAVEWLLAGILVALVGLLAKR